MALHTLPVHVALTLQSVRFRTLNFTLHVRPHNLALFTLDTVWNLGLATLSCCVRTSTCRPELSPLTALLLPTLPKVHSGAKGGPLNFPLHCALCTPHFTLHTLHVTLHTRQFNFQHTLHATVYTLNFTLHTLRSNFFHTLHPTRHTLRFTLHTLHLALHTFTRGTHHLRLPLCFMPITLPS